MAITINFNGALLAAPGAFSQTVTNLTGGFPLAPTGIVAIIGEAEGGEPGVSAGVQTFTSEDIAALSDTYVAGPIVDAARSLVNPGNDPRVPNGASIIRVYKTNSSTKSNITLQNESGQDLLELSSRNFGDRENLISVMVEAGTQAAQRLITVSRGDISETLSQNELETKLTVQYTGSNGSADLTIVSNVLAVAAGSDSVSIPLAGKSLQDVVDLLNATGVFSASSGAAIPAATDADQLDPVISALDATSAVNLVAAQQELLDIINLESSLVMAELASTEVEGNLAVSAQQFLSGAVKGGSSNSSFQEGFDANLVLRSNTVIPLVSRDASELAQEGLTDPSSTFTVDSINVQANSHVNLASNTLNRSERNAYVSVKRPFLDTIAAARVINNQRTSMLFHDVEVLNAEGELQFFDPWMASIIVAGVQAGTVVGEPTTFKLINVNGIRHQDFRSTQLTQAILGSLTPLNQVDTGGFRVELGNTTFGSNASFVANRVSVVEAADFVAFNLRTQLEAIFVGTKAVAGTQDAVFNTVVAIMTQFLDAEIIVGDDTNDGLGFRDLTVTVDGGTVNVDVTVTPVQGIDFILNRITLDNIRQG